MSCIVVIEKIKRWTIVSDKRITSYSVRALDKETNETITSCYCDNSTKKNISEVLSEWSNELEITSIICKGINPHSNRYKNVFKGYIVKTEN